MMKLLQKRTGILLALIVIFFGPVLVATLMYYRGNTWTGRTVNKGALLRPVVSLSNYQLKMPDGAVFNPKSLRGKWVFMYLDPADCDHDCQENLYKMRQVRQALGKYQDKILRVVVTQPGVRTPELEQLLQHEYAGTQQIIGRFDLARNAIYVVDPRGNIMLHYSNHNSPKDLFGDLKRLLRYSA